MLAIWFCIAFLIYTDDTRRRAAQETSGYAASGIINAGGGGGAGAGVGDPVAMALKNGPISEEEPGNDSFAVYDNAIGESNRVKVKPRQQDDDSLRQNAVVHAVEKPVHKQKLPPKEEGKLSSHFNNYSMCTS